MLLAILILIFVGIPIFGNANQSPKSLQDCIDKPAHFALCICADVGIATNATTIETLKIAPQITSKASITMI
jgi:hypothetical protein